MDGAQAGLKAKDAIDAGFKVFREFFVGTRTSHVLLEGLEYYETDDTWSVIIGFDVGRSKEKREGMSAIMPGFGGSNTSEPMREVREFIVSGKDGSFVRMGTP